jgi:hypothetical protein
MPSRSAFAFEGWQQPRAPALRESRRGEPRNPYGRTPGPRLGKGDPPAITAGNAAQGGRRHLRPGFRGVSHQGTGASLRHRPRGAAFPPLPSGLGIQGHSPAATVSRRACGPGPSRPCLEGRASATPFHLDNQARPAFGPPPPRARSGRSCGTPLLRFVLPGTATGGASTGLPFRADLPSEALPPVRAASLARALPAPLYRGRTLFPLAERIRTRSLRLSPPAAPPFAGFPGIRSEDQSR